VSDRKRVHTNPQDDLISALVQVEEAGEQLSEDELLTMIFLMIISRFIHHVLRKVTKDMSPVMRLIAGRDYIPPFRPAGILPPISQPASPFHDT
jgi:hypothetical protein